MVSSTGGTASNALRNRSHQTRLQTKYANDEQREQRARPGSSGSSGSASSSGSTNSMSADIASPPPAASRELLKKISTSSLSSGQSTPLAPDAPPSAHVLSSARKGRRATARKKLFYSIDYQARPSTLDPRSGPADFHGFFALFWLALALMVSTTLTKNWFETGHLLRVSMWDVLYANVWQLGRVDALMVLSTGVGVALQKAIRWGGVKDLTTPGGSAWGFLRWERTGCWLQSSYQLAWLLFWVDVPLWLEWTWTATVFFTLHVICLLMKMHSYTFYNGHLSACELELRALDQAADENQQLDKDQFPLHRHAHGSNPNYSPSKKGDKDDGEYARVGSDLPQIDEVSEPRTNDKGNAGDDVGGTRDVAMAAAKGVLSNPAVAEGDVTVVSRRQALASELTSTLGHVTYPANLTWYDYGLYLCSPTLCYELEYPRVKEIRYWKIAVDVLAVFGCIFLMILVSGEFILPVLRESNVKIATATTPIERAIVVAETVNGLLTPFLVEVLLVFLVIFEYICGASAEATRFADRKFYEDWWNSRDWLEFSRKWNLPVHHFLRRHVYFPAMSRYSSATAIALTFLLSSIFHELVMATMSRKIRGYGFALQMLQVPLSIVQKNKWVRQQQGLNNVLFWFSVVCGTSLICSLYVLL